MRITLSYFTLIFFFLFCEKALGQGDELSYTEEFTYGINFNTNGGLIGGLNLKWAKSIGPKQFQCFGFEFVNVKHPKENRIRVDNTGSSYLLYKTNYLFSLRPFYGREFVLFRKASEEGVHINGIVAAGPSFGLLKPYYVLYQDYTTNPLSNLVESRPYIEGLERSGGIQGVGNFTDGLNEIKVTLGMHAKVGLTFEYGQIKNSVLGLEAGFMVEQFAKDQQIMAYTYNRSFYSSAFFTLYYGRKY